MESVCRRYGRCEDKAGCQLCVGCFHSYTPPYAPGHSRADSVHFPLLTMQTGELIVIKSSDLTKTIAGDINSSRHSLPNADKYGEILTQRLRPLGAMKVLNG